MWISRVRYDFCFVVFQCVTLGFKDKASKIDWKNMRDTLRRICELQPEYSSENTPEMQERGRLIRQDLAAEIRALREPLARSLGPFGHGFFVEGSDGIGRKTELAWTRFCSKEMSPRPTDGFYVVLHFSTDGSGVNIAVGCSSSKFYNGYSIVLPLEELDKRCQWAREIVLEDRGSLWTCRGLMPLL